MSGVATCSELARALFARIAPRAPNVNVAVTDETRDGAAVVAAVAHASDNLSSSPGPWTLDFREAAAVVGAAGREAAAGQALGALEAALRAELARFPTGQAPPAAGPRPLTSRELEQAILRASAQGKTELVAQLEGVYVMQNSGMTSRPGAPLASPFRPAPPPGEMLMNSSDVEARDAAGERARKRFGGGGFGGSPL